MPRTIRTMTPDEIGIALDWAKAEGWNPGFDDAEPFAVVDPEGFLLCEVEGEPAACISTINYDSNFGFLGCYIAAPKFRGQGHGWATWQAGMEHLGDRTIGLDGVVAQQDAYQRSGFVYAHRNVRYGGIPKNLEVPQIETEDLGKVLLEELSDFDRQFFPAARPIFLDLWRMGPTRIGRAIRQNGALAGYAVIRKCQEGHKIGPVFAQSDALARALIRDLIARRKPQGRVFLDPPEPNAAAGSIAKDLGLEPVFETARMYKGPAPDLPLERIYGISTFELG